MLELIWALLNFIIIIYFIIICIKSTKIIRDNLGLLASFVFVLGLLSFVGKSNDENMKTKIFDLENKTKQITFIGNTYSTEKIIEDNLISEINVRITYGENKNGKKLLRAYTTRTGFLSGTNWKPQMISVEKTKNENKYLYSVAANLEWKLLGVIIYSELKNFEGEIELKK